ncbi:sugar phosphate nucleotidyltransferase [Escherichia coli]|nr:sugar phosphate nucleotidyltransferase [Escherichia coli]
MAQSKLYPVVMAGGSGSRLWPLSRVLYPKQFLCLKGDLTMLQTTICRLNGVECESPVVICNEQHRFIVAEQLRQLNKLTENIILEPAGRNTAPAIALAALAANVIAGERPVNAGIGGGSCDCPMKTRSVPPCVMPCHMPKRASW